MEARISILIIFFVLILHAHLHRQVILIFSLLSSKFLEDVLKWINYVSVTLIRVFHLLGNMLLWSTVASLRPFSVFSKNIDDTVLHKWTLHFYHLMLLHIFCLWVLMCTSGVSTLDDSRLIAHLKYKTQNLNLRYILYNNVIVQAEDDRHVR